MSAAIAVVDSVDEVREAILAAPRLLPVGAESKPALCGAAPGTARLGLGGLRGITAYDPAELTISALAGTPLAELEAVLGEHRQALAFDPLLVDAGSTIGGAVATGLSGPASLAHGTIRDFVIGVRIVDGAGRCFAAGGRLVKNAAGFDYPKLMVGSAGRLGVMVEVSCKVFPAVPARATLAVDRSDFATAMHCAGELLRGPIALEALELVPPGRLLVRLGGSPETLDARLARLAQALGGPVERLGDDPGAWERVTAPPADAVVAIPFSAGVAVGLEAELGGLELPRRYSFGPGLVMAGLPGRGAAVDEVSARLRRLGLTGLLLAGPDGSGPLLGRVAANPFAERVRAALDPDRRFPELGS